MAHLLALLLAAATWEGAVRAGWVATLLFPAPTTILHWLLESLRSGELADSLLASGQRLAIGFGLGAGLGTLVGLAMGLLPRLHRAFDPVIAALHPMPKVALLPLFLVLFGFNEQARIVPVALVAFFPAAIAAAVASAALTRCCGMSRATMARRP
ncbi:ABC transporter permease [Roseococcus thiosulfatophilus]|uniref:ABC transporter permease n=1 Tax=Roseococcus thiosulfatophilus TaxID=35813 RepID=UPI001A8E9E74|nr:hypothetical protein [Roseococcus thiosulfatophilus]